MEEDAIKKKVPFKGVCAQSVQIKIRISKKVTHPRQLSISHISKKVMGGFYFMYLWFWLRRTRKVIMHYDYAKTNNSSKLR